MTILLHCIMSGGVKLSKLETRFYLLWCSLATINVPSMEVGSSVDIILIGWYTLICRVSQY